MKNIIFFDGVCNLCNQFVDFILKADKSNKIYIASLQGQTAQNLLKNENLKNLTTIIYYKNNKTFKQSSAVIEIATDLGYPYKLIVIFKIIPATVRDALYSIISKYRYKIFGKRSTCRLPTEKEQEQFLP